MRFSILVTTLGILGCASGSSSSGSLLQTTAEPAGDNCENGGIALDIGVDGNSDDVLDGDETRSTTYICNGLAGEGGAIGSAGPSALIAMVAEPIGPNCARGGTEISAGLDVSGDGVLDPEEITATQYACDGAQGISGADGQPGGLGPAGPAGPAGPQGLPGLAGAPGAPGAAGATGPAGPAGSAGAAGATGATGPTGPQGSLGPAGPQGTSGVVATLDYEGDWTANLGTTPIDPTACQTAAYVAGPGEVAMLRGGATAIFTSTSAIMVANTFNEDSSGVQFANQFVSAGSIVANSAGGANSAARIQLNNGSTYVFGLNIRSLNPVTVSTGVCGGTVTIARE